MSVGRVSIEASHDDALIIFRTWALDRALIRLEFRFRVLAATFLARVSSVSEAEVRFIADDKWAELVLPIPKDVVFRFLDISEFATRARFEGMLVMFYPFVVDPDESDQIVFAEVDEKSLQNG